MPVQLHAATALAVLAKPAHCTPTEDSNVRVRGRQPRPPRVYLSSAWPGARLQQRNVGARVLQAGRRGLEAAHAQHHVTHVGRIQRRVRALCL